MNTQKNNIPRQKTVSDQPNAICVMPLEQNRSVFPRATRREMINHTITKW